MQIKNNTRHGKRVYLHVFFRESDYQQLEQFVVYDGDSFIADVGGYLGLLLGHSLLSVVVGVIIWGERLLNEIKQKSVEDKKRVASES